MAMQPATEHPASAGAHAAWRGALWAFAAIALAAWAVVAIGIARDVGRPFPGFLLDPRGYVWVASDPRWNGPRAGLEPYDRVVRVGGVPVASAADVARAIRPLPPGAPVVYEIVRHGGRRAVTVRTQLFTPADAARASAQSVLPAFLFIVVGVIAFAWRPASVAAQAFLILELVVGLMLAMTWDYGTRQLLAPAYVPASYMFAGALVLIGQAFPEPVGWLARRPWRATWILGAAAALVAADAALLAVAPYQYGTYLFTATAVACMGWLAARLVATARHAPSALARARAQVVLLGLAAPCLALPVNALRVSGFLAPDVGAELFGLTLALAAMFPISIAYAIFKHQLFDIQVLVRRTVVYGAVVALLGLLYFATAALARLLLEAVVEGASALLGQVLATAAVTVGFVPVRARVQDYVDRRFFRAPYDLERVLADFARRSEAELDVHRLAEAFLDVLAGSIAPRYMGILAARRADGALEQVAHRGAWPEGVPARVDDPWVRAALAATDGAAASAPGGMQGAVLLPLVFRQELTGCVVVGPPKSELAFGARDRLLLAHLAGQLALRFTAAELYTRMEALVAARTAELDEALAKLRLAYEDLKQLDALKAAFLNTVSHELRTPLTFIVGFIDAILDETVGEVPEAQRPYLERALAGAMQLSKLIDDLLDYARMEAGMFRLDREELDLGALVKDVAAMSGPLLKEKGLAFSVDAPAELPLVCGDQIRVIQVLNNLLSNAIKYTPAGGTVSVQLRVEDGFVRVEVHDTGLGIPASAMPHLFSRFYRVEGEATRAIKGTGLGLAIAKSLVEGHGGRIGVDSAEGRGSTFWFTLPAVAEAPSGRAPAGS